MGAFRFASSYVRLKTLLPQKTWGSMRVPRRYSTAAWGWGRLLNSERNTFRVTPGVALARLASSVALVAVNGATSEQANLGSHFSKLVKLLPVIANPGD